MPDMTTLKQLVSEALRRQQPVDRAEAKLSRKKMEFTVNKRRSGYINPLVMRSARGLWGGHLGHLKFLPIAEQGLVIVLPALEGELGAEAIQLSETQNAGWVNLYGALHEFPLRFTGNRRLRLPFLTIETTDEGGAPRPVGVLQVQNPETKPRTTRKAKSRRAKAPPAPAAGPDPSPSPNPGPGPADSTEQPGAD